MNAYLKLCRHFWRRFQTPLRWTALLLAGCELLLLLIQGCNSAHAWAPYETVLDAARWGPCFALAALVLFVWVLYGFLTDETGTSRAIYTLLTLPGPAWMLPLAWAATFLAALALLLCVQLVLAFAAYPLYLLTQYVACHAYQTYQNEFYALAHGDYPPVGIRKGLSYAFVRSAFLRTLLPLNLAELPLWLSRLLLPAAAGTAALSHRRWRPALGVWAVLLVLAGLQVGWLSIGTPYTGLAALALEALLLAGSVRACQASRTLV